jgi:hypothetical protein
MCVIVLGCLAACALIALPARGAELTGEPKTADEAALMWMQAVGDRWPDRWQGRQHYLFDEDNPPETTATGRANDTQACANEAVRVPRADGSTAIERMNRCR